MKVYNSSKYPNHKTARQWALQGFLPNDTAQGIELWTNRFCSHHYTYYSIDEVTKATDEQLESSFFKPERERKNQKAREERQRLREKRLAKIERQEYVKRTIPEIESKIKHKGIVIDTETTGLDPKQDELLQVSIIDIEGNVLFNSYFKPKVTSWTSAELVNGISPQMVENSPKISEKIKEINKIVYNAETIIGYNTHFDLSFLYYNGLILSENTKFIDVMTIFAEIYGEWSDYFGDYKWQKLITATDYYNYNWDSHPENAHNSLADCYATLYVYQQIQK
ncbi:MAG: 3'-5' exonuclease [Lachnospiraceae bacterium]|nr:3'-5' exonuclease [Lachnospiraceae bacterium]